MHAENHVAQGGLARAVFAQQRVDLALLDRKRDPTQERRQRRKSCRLIEAQDRAGSGHRADLQLGSVLILPLTMSAFT